MVLAAGVYFSLASAAQPEARPPPPEPQKDVFMIEGRPERELFRGSLTTYRDDLKGEVTTIVSDAEIFVDPALGWKIVMGAAAVTSRRGRPTKDDVFLVFRLDWTEGERFAVCHGVKMTVDGMGVTLKKPRYKSSRKEAPDRGTVETIVVGIERGQFVGAMARASRVHITLCLDEIDLTNGQVAVLRQFAEAVRPPASPGAPMSATPDAGALDGSP
jgi:hypothetical protein